MFVLPACHMTQGNCAQQAKQQAPSQMEARLARNGAVKHAHQKLGMHQHACPGVAEWRGNPVIHAQRRAAYYRPGVFKQSGGHAALQHIAR